MAVVNGYIYRVVARQGLAQHVPALITGEIGWDTDTKTFRVGDMSADPPRVMSTKSTGVFQFPSVTEMLAGGVTLKNGKVDGANLKQLSVLGQGLLMRMANGDFRSVRFASSDNSILVLNGDGSTGVIELRTHNSGGSGSTVQDIGIAQPDSSGEPGLFQFPAVAPTGKVLNDYGQWVPLPQPGGGVVGYTHVQLEAAATWTINHELGYWPSITIFDQLGRIIDADVQNTSADTVVINFSEAIAGRARLI